MARGLSDLQKLILILAHQNKQRQQTTPDPNYSTDVRYAEVLVSYFGFPVTGPWLSSEGTDLERVKRSPGIQKFSKERIGAKRYASAQAAVSRAFRRLEQRGLIDCRCGAIARWSGGNLTEAGIVAIVPAATHPLHDIAPDTTADTNGQVIGTSQQNDHAP